MVHAPEAFTVSFAPDGFENRQFVPMADWAMEHAIPECRREPDVDLAAFVREVGGEVGLVVGWHHNLPPSLLAALPRGAMGVHASRLPDLRGHAPLSWAIITGRSETGVSLFAIDATSGVDEGLVYGQVTVPVAERATIAHLLAAAEDATVQVLAECLPGIVAGTLAPHAQVGDPTYGLRRGPDDGWIDWRRSAEEVDRLVRAVTRPYPGARTSAADEVWFVWAVRPGRTPAVNGAPGQVALVEGVAHPVVVTGDGWVELLDVSTSEGEDRMAAARRWNHLRLIGDQR